MGRLIEEKTFRNPVLLNLELGATVLWCWLIIATDKHGVITGSLRSIKAQAFPGRKGIGIPRIRRWLSYFMQAEMLRYSGEVPENVRRMSDEVPENVLRSSGVVHAEFLRKSDDRDVRSYVLTNFFEYNFRKRRRKETKVKEDEYKPPCSPPKPPKAIDPHGPVVERLCRQPFGLGALKAMDLVRRFDSTEADLDAWLDYEREHGTEKFRYRLQTAKNPAELPDEIHSKADLDPENVKKALVRRLRRFQGRALASGSEICPSALVSSTGFETRWENFRIDQLEEFLKELES